MPSTWFNSECSIHRVQHTIEILSHPLILTISSGPLNVASASGVPPYRSTATSQFSITASSVESPCHIPTVVSQLTDEWSHGAPSIDRLRVLFQSGSITAARCISILTQSWPPSESPKFAQSRLPSVSPDLLDYGLQVHTIMPSRCTSPNSHNHSLRVYVQTHSITACKFAWSRPPTVSPNSVLYGLHKCISQLARSRPRSTVLSPLNRHFQGHVEILSSTACRQFRYTVYIWVAI